MKVLKPGPGWSIKTSCTGDGWNGGGCGAELLVEYPDLFRSTQSQMGRDTCTYVLFKCCECGVTTALGDTDQTHLRTNFPWSFFRELPQVPPVVLPWTPDEKQSS
jgi:hypothetical protein